jgi:hypothetical protein
MDHLKLARMAAYAMNRFTRELGLANLATHYNGDDPNQVLVANHSDIRILDGNHKTADIAITLTDPPLITIVVNNCFDLIRQEHQSLFNPADYGIAHKRTRDSTTRDKHDDLVMLDWPLDNELPDMGPRVIPIRAPRMGKITCKGAMDTGQKRA